MPRNIPEADPDEPLETKPFKFVTGYDARFPQQNQTKHCWQNYVDYHKCVNAKGEDFRPCRQVLSRDPAPDFREFYYAFRSLCPKAWTDRWDTQRESGNFPAKLD
ncbi:Cytochrome c oxidase subunit 6B [Monascus purpureus]|uniref:Cytochrome c oxidase subunit 6B n=1 Tax=Monascus purpureus TaxID=5098 RepID=A0A507QV61_MONPU|nr:Cytochrome c oxidase subunit 6B [Monascus purpureus]